MFCWPFWPSEIQAFKIITSSFTEKNLAWIWLNLEKKNMRLSRLNDAYNMHNILLSIFQSTMK